MRKTKVEKGITLIALIITIVILLILAVVAITSIQSEGIFAHAENAANKWNKSVEEEQGTIGRYEEILNNIDKSNNDDDSDMTVAKVKNEVINKNSNTDVYDEYGNTIVVPAGFKIVVNEDTNNADTVTKGIVIEDCTEAATKESQFVWIPVGKIYTDTEQTEANAKTITLGRYESFELTDEGVYTPAQKAEDYATATKISSYYTEDTESNHTKTNAIARDIGAFVTSATEKGGYYIGRYEAGDGKSNAMRTTSTDGTLVCKANQVPYNYITQLDASSKCQSMYGDGIMEDGTGTFASDLINSYAWDTAIIFIQTFGKTDYASTVGKSSISASTPQKTGTNRLSITNGNIDEQLNIYDMAGNCYEWSTETSGSDGGLGVYRGGVTGNTRTSTGWRGRRRI